MSKIITSKKFKTVLYEFYDGCTLRNEGIMLYLLHVLWLY